jgi:hypothetical protein
MLVKGMQVARLALLMPQEKKMHPIYAFGTKPSSESREK